MSDSIENRYEGEKNASGLKHGNGIFFWSNGEMFEGEWQDDKMKQGKYTWPNGTEYNGGFKNGKRYGKGKYTYPDKDYEDGVWKDDKLFHGIVKKTNDHGFVYIGEYKEGCRHGSGKLFDSKGLMVYDGLFENGEFIDGNVNDTNSNGYRYEGQYKNGNRHGKGKLFNPDGTINYEGYFINGIAQQWFDEIEFLIGKIADENRYEKQPKKEKSSRGFLSFFSKSDQDYTSDSTENIEQLYSKYLSRDYRGYAQGFIYLYYAKALKPINEETEAVIKFLKSLKQLHGFNENFDLITRKFYEKIDDIELKRIRADYWIYEIEKETSHFGQVDAEFSGKKLFSVKSNTNSTSVSIAGEKHSPTLDRIGNYIGYYKKFGFKNEEIDKYHEDLLLKISNTKYYWSIPSTTYVDRKHRNKDGSLDKRYKGNKK